MTTADTMPQVDGLHDLAEALEQTGIPTRDMQVSFHTEDGADAARLADALALTDRLDFKTADGHHRDFTRWTAHIGGVTVTVMGDTPEEDPR